MMRLLSAAPQSGDLAALRSKSNGLTMTSTSESSLSGRGISAECGVRLRSNLFTPTPTVDLTELGSIVEKFEAMKERDSSWKFDRLTCTAVYDNFWRLQNVGIWDVNGG